MTPEELAIMNWQAQNEHIAQQNALRMQQQQSRDQQRQNAALSWEYQYQTDLANQANENRYADILQLLGVNRNNVLADINNWGQSQVDDANDRYKKQEAAGIADAYARGFGGSPSVMNAARNQANRSRDAEINRIRDNQISQRVGASERTTNNIAGVMERRNDVAPDLAQLIGLQQGLGRVGGGGGYAPMPVGSRNQPQAGNPYLPSIGRQPPSVSDSQYNQAIRDPYGNWRGIAPGGPIAGLHGGTGKIGAERAMTPYIPLTMPAAPAPVGYTGLGEVRRSGQLPYSKPMGYAYQTADSQYTSDGNGGIAPLYAPVRQTLPTVPGMVGATGGGSMLPYYGNMNTGYHYTPPADRPDSYYAPYQQRPTRPFINRTPSRVASQQRQMGMNAAMVALTSALGGGFGVPMGSPTQSNLFYGS